MARSISEYFLIGSILLFLFAVSYLGNVIWQERIKVQKMPKVPMTLCDMHGAYPTSMSLKITVPAEGKQDLVQEICPVCYKDRLDAVKEK